MSILNIGGTGFIGGSLTKQLLEEGRDVTCFDLRPGDVPAEATVIQGDVTDIDALEAAVEDHEPDIIAHLAYVLTAESQENPGLATRVNCVGMDNVLRVAADHGVDRVVYASSLAAMGSHAEYPRPVTEEMQVPAALSQFPEMSLYGAAKQFNEFQAREYERQTGIETIGIRPTIVFGPGRVRGRSNWASTFVTGPATGDNGHIACQPEQPLCMVYRDDVAALFADALLAETADHSVYLSGGHTITARELADLVESVVGGTVTCDPAADPIELPPKVSHERARESFGFELTPLETAIQEHATEVA
ncbi:MAG: NAD-dependent epimerase/dehydratase family protein [Salinirussus sp.]